MVEIATHQNSGGILQKDIAKNQGISNKYLDHIIYALKVGGLVRNKGKKIGYVLTRDISEITLLEIHNALEPDINIVKCLEAYFECPRENECKTREFWHNLNNVIIDQYKSVTLQDLVNEAK